MVENARGLIQGLFGNFPGGTEENNEIFNKDSDYLDDIRTEHLPNASLERYRYANQLSPTAFNTMHYPPHIACIFHTILRMNSDSFVRREGCGQY